MIHVYYGDGKGKTTAAMGMALRAVNAGQRVVIVQFLKSGDSGEIAMLKKLGATVFCGKSGQKFVSQMSGNEKRQTCELQNKNLHAALCKKADLLVLDEACAAWQLDMIDKTLLRSVVENAPKNLEIVLTGRAPADWMLNCADYITEMCCRKHPFECGVTARKGVEF